MSVEHSDNEDYLGPSNKTWAIFWVSVLGLFLEMLLIRWVGTEIRIFAYLQNTILVVCFLGLGLGLFTCRKPVRLARALVPLTVLMILLAIPFTRRALGMISERLSVLGDLVIWWSHTSASPWETLLHVVVGLVAAAFILILIVDIFVPFGRILGRLMEDHPQTLWAYSVNIGGSLLGTWAFALVSFLHQPPVIWFVIFAGLALFFSPRKGTDLKLNLVLLLVIVVLGWVAGLEPGALQVIWSPYQKLAAFEFPQENSPYLDYEILVNNVGYQSMTNLSAERVAAYPGIFDPDAAGLSQYDIPLLLHPDPQTFLIVGAGAGNDAAGGLRSNVAEVTAVEIDPGILKLGRTYHPENPYASSAVKQVTDDARSFFATTDQKFDVIAFGLLDSHTTTAMTNARLDHYVYTRESIQRARSLLAPGGVMVLTFEAAKPYIADRMARVLNEVFGEDPIAIDVPASPYGYGGVMFVSGDLEVARTQIAQNPRLSAYIERLQVENPLDLPLTTKIATDDWPYIYLETPRIPVLYYLLAGLLVLIAFRSYKYWQAGEILSQWHRSHWHFFFLGAAFLLLEVQNISKASVVLGNTWQVNAVIVSGVLTMALLANLVTQKFPKIPLGIVYGALIVTCVALYFVDLAQFAFLPYAAKAVVVGGLTTLPMLFSGIVFARSFTQVTNKSGALGANMIGSLIGALLQSMTFVTGIKALLLVVAALYVLSLLTRPRGNAVTA